MLSPEGSARGAGGARETKQVAGVCTLWRISRSQIRSRINIYDEHPGVYIDHAPDTSFWTSCDSRCSSCSRPRGYRREAAAALHPAARLHTIAGAYHREEPRRPARAVRAVGAAHQLLAVPRQRVQTYRAGVASTWYRRSESIDRGLPREYPYIFHHVRQRERTKA